MAARAIVAGSVLVALAACAGAGARETSLPLREVARISLPGPANRFDYASIDPHASRLYIAHMNASTLVTFDLRKRRVIGTLPVPGIHGVIAVPALGRVFVSATDAHEAWTIDARTGRVLARAPAGSYPDGLAYDPAERRVFVSDEAGGVETVLNAKGARIATVELGGEAGNVQYDAGWHRTLVDVQSKDEVAVIDPATNKVVRRVHVDCDHDHGLHVDAPRRLAFVACDGDAKLLTLDLRRMRVTQTSAVGGDPDVLALDTRSHRLYVAAESGEVAVFAEGAHRLTKLGQSFLAANAHTVAVDPRTHLVYFPLERGSSGRPQLLIMKPR